MTQTIEVPRLRITAETTGTYTQIPNVFLDTCDLPETAQLLYLRLARHLWREGHAYRGSVRKLSSLVRLPKSTVGRMAKMLKEADLMNIAYEEGQETSRAVMVVTLNKAALWDLNKQYYENPCAVPEWDTKLPHCPNLGQDDTTLGQEDLTLGQDVPGSRSKSDPKQMKTLQTHTTQGKQECTPSTLSPRAREGDLSSHLLSLLEQVTEEELMLALKTILEQREQPAPSTPGEAAELASETCTQASMPEEERLCKEEKPGKIVPFATKPAQETKPTEPAKQGPAHSAATREPMATPPIVLSERAQTVYRAWASMPWFRGVPPELTEMVARHCTALAAYDPLPTAEEMLSVRRWHEEHYPERKGWYLGNVVSAYPQYLSDQYQSQSAHAAKPVHREAASSPKETTIPAAAPSAAETSPSLPPQKQRAKEGQKKRRAVSVAPEVVLTLQGGHILDLYDSVKGRKTTRSVEALRAANGLGEVVRSDEDFVAVLAAIASDSFLKQKQVRTDLDFVYRKYDGFLDRVERARKTQQTGSVQTDYNKVATMTGEERAAYKQEQQEKLKQEQPPGIDREALMKLTPEERIAVLKAWRKPPLSA